MSGLIWLLITLLVYVIIVSVFHELGHYFALRAIGIESKLSFNIKHFKVSYDNDKLKTKSIILKLLVYCSGILASLIIVSLLLIIFDYMWFKIFLILFFIIEILIQLFKKEGDLRKALSLFY